MGLCFNLDIYRINRLCTAIITDTVKLLLASKLLHALHCVTLHDFVVHACMHVQVYCAILTYCARGPLLAPARLAGVYWPVFSHTFVNSFPSTFLFVAKKFIMRENFSFVCISIYVGICRNNFLYICIFVINCCMLRIFN